MLIIGTIVTWLLMWYKLIKEIVLIKKVTKNGYKIKGKVINVGEWENSDGQILYYPIIEFTTKQQELRVIEPEVYLYSNRYEIGSDIYIYYLDDKNLLIGEPYFNIKKDIFSLP